MSKFIADRAYRIINEKNELVVCFVINGEYKRGALLSMEEVKATEKQLEIQIKEHRSQRSLEQNRLLWALLGKMAEAMSGNKRRVSSEECYCIMLEEANVKYDYMLALPEAEDMLRKTFRAIRKLDEREVNGRKLNMYQYFIGSSKFNTKEMTELIEATLDKLAELGIYDSEIEIARKEYRL